MTLSIRSPKVEEKARRLARIRGLSITDVRASVDGDRPELLALTCLCAGIDRSVFPSMLDLIRHLNEGRPSGSTEGMKKAAGLLGANTPETASMVLREALCA